MDVGISHEKETPDISESYSCFNIRVHVRLRPNYRSMSSKQKLEIMVGVGSHAAKLFQAMVVVWL